MSKKFYLRHTYHIEISADNVSDARAASVNLVEDVRQHITNYEDRHVIDVDREKDWELWAQNRRSEEPQVAAIPVSGSGTDLCYDQYSGRYFRGSMDAISRAASEQAVAVLEEGEASLNDFYDRLDLSPITMGELLGWRSGDRIEVQFGSALARNGLPAISFWFRENPRNLA